jgi:hypothetical protein
MRRRAARGRFELKEGQQCELHTYATCEVLVGRGHLSAESISLVLAGPAEDTYKEIKEEVPPAVENCLTRLAYRAPPAVAKVLRSARASRRCS